MAQAAAGLETSRTQLFREGLLLKCRNPEKAISVIKDNQWKKNPSAGQQKEGQQRRTGEVQCGCTQKGLCKHCVRAITQHYKRKNLLRANLQEQLQTGPQIWCVAWSACLGED